MLGQAPRLLGPLTAATHLDIPAGGTVVGVRLRPGVVGGPAGMPAAELTDTDAAGTDVRRDLNRLTDLLGDAPSPQVALDLLQGVVRRAAGARTRSSTRRSAYLPTLRDGRSVRERLPRSA